MAVEKAEIKKYAKRLSLEIFCIGCDKINFSILEMTLAKPTTIKEIRKKFDLSSMPANRRVNQLVEVGLIKREYKKTKIRATKISKIFINIINHIKTIIEKEIEVEPKLVFK